MKLKSKIFLSSLVSIGVLVTTIFKPIAFCRTAPAVPNPLYKWTLCTLNPYDLSNLASKKLYFGLTSSSTTALLSTFLIIFVLLMFLLHFISKEEK